MPFELSKTWWALVLRGIVGLLLGIAAISRPGITLFLMVTLFAAYALLDGALAIAAALRASRTEERWAPLLVEGIMGVGVGAATFLWPHVTVLVLLTMIAVWAVAKGVFEVITAIHLRKLITGEWLLALGGVLSVLLGVVVVVRPVVGALGLALLIGMYVFFYGIVLIALGFRLRHWMHHPGPPAASGTA
jgi:uncharacterized membrane protein HdeD (DUF308 family)